MVGAPVDGATTFRSGARMGPTAIRNASLMLTDGVNDRYPVDLRHHVGDAGDVALPAGYTSEMLDELTQASLLLSDRHVVTLGGDHSITYGILNAHWHRFGDRHLALVHFDAHCDTWDGHFGMRDGHGTWLRRAIEDDLVNPAHCISIGVRSPADQVARMFLDSNGGTTISARAAMGYPPSVMSAVIKSKVQDRPCYLSLDIDCLDPAYAPGTGTPEIGGLTSMWLMEVLENLSDVNWIGMDCVEVAPAYDHSEITALAAATFCWQYLSMNVQTHR